MGLLERFVLDRAVAINLFIAKKCSGAVKPLIEVDDMPLVGQLEAVSVKNGTAEVVMPIDKHLQVPARKVYLFNDADVAD